MLDTICVIKQCSNIDYFSHRNHARHQAELRPLQDQIDQIDMKKLQYEDKIKKARNDGDRTTRDFQSFDDQHQSKIAAIAKANGDFQVIFVFCFRLL